jgi:hypothetical protein
VRRAAESPPAFPDTKDVAAPKDNRVADLPDLRNAAEHCPRVELDAREWAKHDFKITMAAEEWKGRRLREIVAPSSISRVIRVRESGFASGNDALAQERCDALMENLIRSKETAKDYAWLALERPLTSFVLLTKDGKPYHIEVLGMLDKHVSSINTSGEGKGARIEVKGFKKDSSLP